MKNIRAITFAPFARKGTFLKKETYKSAKAMIERTGINWVILVPFGLQETAHSEEISWELTVDDDELADMIDFFHSNDIKVALKPTVNCKNGTWRAHIAFFDKDVVCEPKWSNWFKSYSDFQCHFAKIAEEKKCEMFIAGCEMVMSEHRDEEWRGVIADIRKCYSGTVSYNTDKYQEDNVTWWDAVDIISSSGYYPINDWERQLDRIEAVAKKFGKPFFFAETGCMSATGSQNVPNDWSIKGEADLIDQRDWYIAMTEAVAKRAFVEGVALWSWSPKLYKADTVNENRGYEIYLKPSEKVVAEFFGSTHPDLV